MILDSGSSEVVESIIEQQEPKQEVYYYYQGKHPLCTILIPSFVLYISKNSDTAAC